MAQQVGRHHNEAQADGAERVKPQQSQNQATEARQHGAQQTGSQQGKLQSDQAQGAGAQHGELHPVRDKQIGFEQIENQATGAWLGGELSERQRLQILLAIHRAILETQDLKAIAQIALEHCPLLATDVRASGVVLFDMESAQVEVLALLVGDDFIEWPEEERLSLEDLAIDLELLGEGQVDQVPDLGWWEEQGRLMPLQAAMRQEGILAYLAAPLRGQGKLIGMLTISSGQAGPFEAGQVQAIQELADSLAVAIQQARLLEAEQQRRREAENLRDVMSALASSVNVNQVLEVILRSLGKVLRYDRAALYMVDQAQPLRFGGQNPRAWEDFPNVFPGDDPVIEVLRRTRQPLIVADLQEDKRFAAWPEQELVRGWMGVPLFAGTEMIGVVSLGNLDAAAYGTQDAGLAQEFTRQAAAVLNRARQQEDSSRRAEELEQLTAFSVALRQVEGRQDVLAALMEQARQVFGAAQGTFLLLEEDESALVVTFSQEASLIGSWHAHGSDPLWQVVQTGEAIFIAEPKDFQSRNPYPIYQALLHNAQAAALLPLRSEELRFGVLCFTFEERREFGADERRLLQALSEIAGTALRRAATLETLERQVNRRTRHLSTLYEISALASEPADLEQLLGQTLAVTMEALNSPAGAIHLLEEGRIYLRLAAQKHLPGQVGQDFDVLDTRGSFWRSLVSSSKPAILADVRSDPRTPSELLASPYPAYLAAPVRAKGQTLGLLSLFSEGVLDYTIEEITLFTTIAEQIGGTVERARLLQQAERAAVADERQRLARELHDSISQLLYSLVLYAGAGRKVLKQGDLETSADYLERINQTSLQALKEMRLMVYELRPAVFREEGLVGALNRRLQAVEKRTGINPQLSVEGELDLDEDTELALYRICEEALNNALKHADATEVSIRLRVESGAVHLEIEDNGKGFDPEAAAGAGGLGLLGMTERVRQLGGKLKVQSAPGKGAKVSVYLEVKG